MRKISKRNSDIIQSPIRSLVPFAREAELKGREIIYLNIGQPDIHTPQAALEKIKSYKDQVIKYGRSEGREGLRREVVNYYQTFNVQLDIDNVYVTTGASEAIMFTLFTCFDAGDEIIIPEPFYANYLGFASISGIHIKPISTYLENAFALPDADEFEKCIGPNTKAIFLCNPGNPTGQIYNKEELLNLSELVIKNNLYLIVDEVYREFCYDKDFFSVLRIPELEDHVIVIDSISKVFSACGARVGFIVSKIKPFLASVDKLGQLRLSPPIIGQIIAEECYKVYHDYVVEVKKEYNLRRKILFQRLLQIEHVKCNVPSAAFYIMAELPVKDAAKFCKWMLSEFEYNNTTLMLAPGNGFYFNESLGKNQVRIAYVLSAQKIHLAMDCLEVALERYMEIEEGELVAKAIK